MCPVNENIHFYPLFINFLDPQHTQSHVHQEKIGQEVSITIQQIPEKEEKRNVSNQLRKNPLVVGFKGAECDLHRGGQWTL